MECGTTLKFQILNLYYSRVVTLNTGDTFWLCTWTTIPLKSSEHAPCMEHHFRHLAKKA